MNIKDQTPMPDEWFRTISNTKHIETDKYFILECDRIKFYWKKCGDTLIYDGWSKNLEGLNIVAIVH